MRYRLLGKSGLRVSELCLGTMLSVEVDDATRATYPGRGGSLIGLLMVIVHPPIEGLSL